MLVARRFDTRQLGHVPGHVDQSAGLRRARFGGSQQEVSLKWIGVRGDVILKLVVVIYLIYDFVGGGRSFIT